MSSNTTSDVVKVFWRNHHGDPFSNDNAVPIVIVSIVFHLAVFALTPFVFPAFSTPLRRSYVVSTVHAVAAVFAVVLWLCVFDFSLSDERRVVGAGVFGSGDEWQYVATSWTLGYFCADTAALIAYDSLFNAQSLVHHVLLGSSLILTLWLPACRPVQFALLLEETSTIPLNGKAIFKALNAPHAEFGCAIAFAVTFIGARMVYGLFIFIVGCSFVNDYVRAAITAQHYAFACAVLYQVAVCGLSRLLNLYWTALIIRKLTMAARGQTEAALADETGREETHQD